MIGSLRVALVPLLAGCLLALAPSSAMASRAEPPRKSGVSDKADLFPAEDADAARKKIEALNQGYRPGVYFETIKELPEKYRARLSPKTRDSVFRDFAEERYKELGVGGIYVMMSGELKRTEVYIGKRTRDAGFDNDRRDRLTKAINSKLTDGPGKALLAGVDAIGQEFKAMPSLKRTTTTPTDTKGGAKVSAGKDTTPANEGWSIWTWVIVIVVGLLVLWLVVGLIRAFTGVGGGGNGGGGYSGGGGGGGGGGGFFTSLLGGLFGAAAGMYLYDSFFRSHTPTPPAPTPTTYDPTPSAPVDDTAGGTGGGADWGGDEGGGDDAGGGGGADWGGGGDGGGGADWGGGDEGGGADWGGGDAGGGADWGGGGDGGGGGDW